jgi:hypothetical protein
LFIHFTRMMSLKKLQFDVATILALLAGGGVILTLTLHNNDTTPRHNRVGFMYGPHSIVPWCCVIVV